MSQKILVVDDNPANLKLVTVVLSTGNYELHTASSASEALSVLDSLLPDLILLDIQLPDMDGLELTAKLKAAPRTQHLKIVALTAYAMKGDEEKAKAAGMDGYIKKPFEKAELRRVVASFLSEPAISE